MKEEQVIDGNLLIARFMGGKYKKSAVTLKLDKERIYMGEDEVMYFTNKVGSRYCLQYHCSWSALMEVVEKISSLGYVFVIRSASDAPRLFTCYFEKPYTEKTISESEWQESAITAVYTAVTQFIEWYNQNK